MGAVPRGVRGRMVVMNILIRVEVCALGRQGHRAGT